MISKFKAVLALSAIGAAMTAIPANALTIVPTFDATITSDPQGAQMVADIQAVVALYAQLFTDPITVSIYYQTTANMAPQTYLGENQTLRYAINYSAYVAALTADATDANDALAIANLPSISPTERIELSSANGRALGLNTPGQLTSAGAFGGSYDSVITFNTALGLDADRTDGTSGYDFMRLVEHETDEALGFGSALNGCSIPSDNNTCLRPQDLYRYSAAGVMSFSTGAGSSYFSIDGGVTDLVNFNQTAGADYGDWTQGTGFVQDGLTFPNQVADISSVSVEGTTLDILGYDSAVPEPSTLLLLPAGLVGLMALRRRTLRA